jgi:hypothetical protein
MCQKASGGPFMAFTGVPIANLVWTRGQPKTFASSTTVTRGFCADRGTPLAYRRLGGERGWVTTGSLDDPSAVPPQDQCGLESKIAWLDTIAALPERAIGDALIESRQHPDHDT